MLTDPIRCGLLGTGHSHAGGKMHVLQESDNWDFIGVCEPDAERRAQREQEEAWADVHWISEDKLLGDETVQLIAVESEVSRLLELGRKAVAAGKHIHLDKPAGTSLPEFRALLDDADRQGLIVQMGYMFRYNAGFDLVRQAMHDGWLGDVHYVHAAINSELNGELRRQFAFHPGGMMLELGCHVIDMIILLLGRPLTVTPYLRHDAATDDTFADNTLAVLEFESTIAVVESAAMEVEPAARRQFEVCGSNGTIIVQPLEAPAVRLCLRKPSGLYEAGWQRIEVPEHGRYKRDVEELARCIRGEATFPYPTEHDFTVQETVLRACGTV